MSDHISNSTAQAAAVNPSAADLSSCEAACLADPDFRAFDSTLQGRISRAINSTAVGLDVRSLSLDSLSQLVEYMLDNNQEVLKIILQNKRDIWKNKELSDLVDDYFENSLLTLDFCAALDACLKRAGHIESIINVALRKFKEEHNTVTEEESVKDYSGTLEELRNFKTAEDPFTQQFFEVFNSVYSHQLLMLNRLQAKKRKLDNKLRKLKPWRKLRKVSNVMFVVTFASVWIFSVVAAAMAAPPVLTALAAAATVPLGLMGKWINSIRRKCEKDIMGQSKIISSMQIGNYFVIKDLDNIRVLADRFQIHIIEALLANADFAMQEEEAVVIVVENIKKLMDSFIKTIYDFREHGNRCNQGTRMARTLILRRIMNYTSSSNQEVGMFS